MVQKVIKILLISLVTLSAVEGFTQQTKSATATWDANTEADLAGYKIYYGTAAGNYTKSFDIGNQTSVPVNKLDVGKTYYFAVTAYDIAGNESGFSKEVSLFIPADLDTTPPAPPGGLKLELIVVLGAIGFLAFLAFLVIISRRKDGKTN